MSTHMLDGAERRFAEGTLAHRLVALRSLCSRIPLIHQEPWRLRACFAVAAVDARSAVRLPMVAASVDRCVDDALPGAARAAAAALRGCGDADAMRHAAIALAEHGRRSYEHAELAVLHGLSRAEQQELFLEHGSLRTKDGVIERFGVRRFAGPVSRARDVSPSLALVAALCDAGRLGTAERIARKLRRSERAAAQAWLSTAEHAVGAERPCARRLAPLPLMWVDFALSRMLRSDLARGHIDEALGCVRRISSSPRRDRALLRVARHFCGTGDVREARRYWRRCEKTEETMWRDLVHVELLLREGALEEAGALLKNARSRVGSRKPRSVVDRVAAPGDLNHPATRVATLALALSVVSRGTVDVLRDEDARELSTLDEALFDAVALSGEGSDLTSSPSHVSARAQRVAGDALRYAAIQRALDRLPRRSSEGPRSRGERALIAGVLLAEDDAASEPAMSEHRALYDEGVSLSAEAAARRRRLLRAAKWSLKQAIDSDDPGDDRLVASRLRCVVNLGGGAAGVVLRSLALRALSGRHLRPILGALGPVSPRAAAELLSTRYAAVADHHEARRLLRAVEERGGFEVGFVERWQQLRRDLRERKLDADVWWAAFSRRWWEQHDEPVPVRCLERLIECCDETEIGSVSETFDRVNARSAQVFRCRYWELPTLLRSDETALALVSASCSASDLGGASLSVEQWQALLEKPSLTRDRVHEPMVSLCAAQLRGASEVASRLLRGASPTAQLETPVAVLGGYELRLLDKRHDFFAYLRFADCAPCCFNSSRNPNNGLQRWVFALWRDPLSFCFLIVRQHRAEGFIFGSFARVGDEPAVLLNGVYLRRSRNGLREAVIAAIERDLCRPLHVRWVGLASRHGGSGPPPEGYKHELRPARRYRALAVAGVPVTDIYDDISGEVNRPTQLRLYWKRLPRAE